MGCNDETLAELQELFESLRELRRMFPALEAPEASMLTGKEVNR